jgi:hypothetical protein
MKEIKITNGVVVIKDFCSRKLKKEITRVLSAETNIKTVDGKQEVSGLSIASMENANDVALVGMTESITIDGQPVAPSVEAYDNMSIEDVGKVLKVVNEITNPQLPNA